MTDNFLNIFTVEALMGIKGSPTPSGPHVPHTDLKPLVLMWVLMMAVAVRIYIFNERCKYCYWAAICRV